MRTEVRYKVRLINHRDKIFDIQVEESDCELDVAPVELTWEQLLAGQVPVQDRTITKRVVKKVQFTGCHEGYDSAFRTEEQALAWAAERGWTRVKQ